MKKAVKFVAIASLMINAGIAAAATPAPSSNQEPAASKQGIPGNQLDPKNFCYWASQAYTEGAREQGMACVRSGMSTNWDDGKPTQSNLVWEPVPKTLHEAAKRKGVE